MSNFTTENLIEVPASSVPAGTLAMKVGQNIFTAGRVIIQLSSSGTQDLDAYVVQSNSGVLYARKLKFNGTQASDSQTVELLSDSSVLIFKTGHPEPTPAPEPTPSPVTSMDLYKCASVDTTNQTWTGYKAVLSNGVYSFESTATSGLTYGIAFTPLVDKIYDDGALVKVDKLYIGLDPTMVFYAPLDANSATAVTGQVLTQTGTVTYQNYQGIDCAYLNGSSYIQTTDRSDLTAIRDFNSFSVSVWLNTASTGGYEGVVCGGYNTVSYGIVFSGGEIGYQMYSDRKGVASYQSYYNQWTHICLIGDNGTLKMYINGVQRGSSYTYQSITDTADPLTIAAWSYGKITGYIAAVRIYSRALTTTEIAALAAEFTPSAS